MGKSFLGTGILCRYRRAKCRNDPEIRKTSRKERSTRRTVDNRATIKHPGAAQPRPAPSGGRPRPPYGGAFNAPPLGWGFLLLNELPEISSLRSIRRNSFARCSLSPSRRQQARVFACENYFRVFVRKSFSEHCGVYPEQDLEEQILQTEMFNLRMEILLAQWTSRPCFAEGPGLPVSCPLRP